MLNRFKIIVLICIFASTSMISSCSSNNSEKVESDSKTSENDKITRVSYIVDYDSDDKNDSQEDADISNINLNNNSINFEGTGASVTGKDIIITANGTYKVSGTLDDGQIIVRVEDNQIVRLILDNADITCEDSAPIYVMSAKKTIITLAEGSKNKITDSKSYKLDGSDSDEPSASIFSKDNLTFNGNGSLAIDSNYKTAIRCNDGLKIINSNLNIDSIADGIKGKDFIGVKNANIAIKAKGDGLKSNNDKDTKKGFVSLDDGKVNIDSGEDGVQAETGIIVKETELKIVSGGGNTNGTQDGEDIRDFGNKEETVDSEDTEDTDKNNGLVAGSDITISSGKINIDSSEDTMNSDNNLIIDDGTLTLLAGDDALKSDSHIEINGGNIDINTCYEGIESENITFNDGNINITSSDDSINAVGNDNSEDEIDNEVTEDKSKIDNMSEYGDRPKRDDVTENGKRPSMDDMPDNYNNGDRENKMSMGGKGNFGSSGTGKVTINGGYISINSDGDGIDVNGSIYMTDGKLLINGPTTDRNGALDYDGTFEVTGGIVVAAGSSGMAQAPSDSSKQYSVLMNYESNQSSKTLVHIESDKGEEILTFKPAKDYQSIVLCSPKLKDGSSYFIYSGGTYKGEEKDGLYSEGAYTKGTKTEEFTVSNIVTQLGSQGRGSRNRH
ncbi:MAG: carbohydrate-binding domain-containing protein [Clostridiales bacterium]